MARTYEDIKNRKKKQEEEDVKTSVSSSESRSNKMWRKRQEKSINFDTFSDDINSTNTTLNSIITGWQDADTMKNTRSSVEGMYNRLLSYEDYRTNYNTDLPDLTEITNAYKSALDGWDKQTELYGQYKNADAYNVQKKQWELSDRFRIKTGKNEETGEDEYRGLTFDEVQNELKKYSPDSDEYKFLSNYTGYTNLKDFEKALESANQSPKGDFSVKEKYISGVESDYTIFDEQKIKQDREERLKELIGDTTLDELESSFKVSNTLESAVADRSGYRKDLEEARNRYMLENGKFDNYKHLSQNEDFAEGSKYIPTGFNIDGLYGYSEADLIYEYINSESSKGLMDLMAVGAGQNGAYSDAGYDLLKEDEKLVFNYLYYLDKKNGTKNTNTFLKDMKNALQKRVSEKRNTNREEMLDNPFMATAFSGIYPVASLAGIGGNLIATGKDLITGSEYNPYDPLREISNAKAHGLNVVSENIAEATQWSDEMFGWNIPSFLYQTGESRLESLLSGYAFGSAGAALMGVNAYQQKAKELTEQGVDKNAVQAQAITEGALEAVFEYLGFEHLIKLKDADSIGKVIYNALVSQGNAEGLEELGTFISTTIADIAFRGEDSEYVKKYNDLLKRGYSKREAGTEIAKAIANDTAQNYLGGYLSGEVGGGIHSYAEYKGNKNAGQTIRANERIGDVMNIASLSPKESTAYKAYTKYANKGITADNIKNAQLGNLAISARADAQAVLDSKTSTEAQKAQAKKVINDLEAYTQKNQTTAIGKLTAKEIFKGKPADIKNDISSLIDDGFNMGKDTQTWKLATELAEKHNKGEKITEAEIAKYVEVMASESNSEGNTKVAERLTELGEKGDVSKIAEIITKQSTGQMLTSAETEILENSENASRVIAEMEQDFNQELIEASEGMDNATATLFIQNYDGETDVQKYADSFNLALDYSKMNFNQDTILAKRGVLSPRAVQNIYNTAVVAPRMERQRAIDDIIAKHSGKISYKPRIDDSIIDYDNKGTKGKVKWSSLTKRQQEAITFIKGFAKVSGINVVFVNDRKYNGKYKGSENTIYIDVHAGIDIARGAFKDSIIPTFSHELVHWAKAKSPALYAELSDKVFDARKKATGLTEVDLVERKRAELKESLRRDVSYEYAKDEIIARSCEDMLSMSEEGKKLFNSLSEKDQKTIVEKFKEFIQNIVDWVNELLGQYESKSEEAQDLRKLKEEFQDISKTFDKLIMSAIEANKALETEGIRAEEIANEATQKVGIGVDMETESAYPSEQFSENTWTHSEYVENREVAVNALVKAIGVTKADAERYIDNINSIARLIADDRARLDYDSNIDNSATVLKSNQEYKWTLDMSTLCAKRLITTGTFDAIQKALPNTVFDSEDIVSLREMLLKRGYEVACGICYVESTRRELGPITAEFIERYKESQRTGKPITRINSEGKEKILQEKGTKNVFYADKNYTPTLAELNTTDIDLVKRDHPEVYSAYLTFMNSRGQAKPKLLETRAEYNGDILKHFNKSAVESRNAAGGLRVQSFSDFEVAHLIDMMQAVLDMSRVGLMSQAYTKVPAFADVFGGTGMKINLSLIAKDSGLDKNGNLIFDDVEGINHKEAFRLREKYSKNVGTILVGKNDAHIIAAMADPRIDFIIPFHKSSWKESLYDSLGLTGYDNYTDTQNEKPIDKDRKIKNFQPSEYWDYSKSGDENAQIYLEKCKEDGRIPKFPQFQTYPGYWKLLIDFKMYDNDGVGSPQNVVKPEFDMDSANEILNNYEGGHRSFPVAKDVVRDFVKEYKEKHQQADEDEQFSEKEIIGESGKNYGMGVYLDSSLLTNLTESERKEMVKLRVKEELAGRHFIAYDNNNDAVDIRLATKDEKIKNQKGDKKKVLRELYRKNINLAIKQEAVVLVDELIENAKYDTLKGAKYPHDWLDNYGQNDWDYWKVYIQEKNKTVWEATLNIATSANGEKILYDIDPIEMVEEGVKSPSTTTNDIIYDSSKKSNEQNVNIEDEQLSEKDSAGNVLTEAQQRFFEDSVARDGDGNLLVLYHGTPNGSFTEFRMGDESHSSLMSAYGAGYYFDSVKASAARYTKAVNKTTAATNPKVFEVHLNIKNPIRITDGVKTISKEQLVEIISRGNYEWFFTDGMPFELRKKLGKTKEEIQKLPRKEIISHWAEKTIEEAYSDADILSKMVKAYKGGSILFSMKEVLGNDGAVYKDKYGEVWVAWDSNQIKSVDNSNPTSNSDIRFSEKDYGPSAYDIVGEHKTLEKRYKKLEADFENYKERVKLDRTLTKGRVMKQSELEAVARFLVKHGESNYKVSELAKSLNDLYVDLQDGAMDGSMTWEEMYAKAYEVAEIIRSEAKVKTVRPAYYDSILKEIRSARIAPNAQQKGDAKHRFGDHYVGKYRGRVTIANDGTPLDIKWKEWASEYPSVFDENISDAQMLVELYDIYDDLRNAEEVVTEYEESEMLHYLATEIINKAWLVTKYESTADKYDKRIKELNFEHRKAMEELKNDFGKKISDAKLLEQMYYGKILHDLRVKRTQEVAEAKKLGREKLAKYKENMERKTHIQRITSNALTLNRWLVKNSKDEHIHEALKGPVINLLNAIDFSSKRMLDEGIPTQKDISLAKALGKVKDMMLKASNGNADLVQLYGHGLDADIEAMMNSIENMDRTIADNEYILQKMSLADLNTLDNVVKAIKHAVSKLNEFHKVNHARGIAHLSQNSMEYLDSLGNGKVFDGMKGKLDKTLIWNNTLPYYAFKRYGEGGMLVYEALQDGWDTFAFNVDKVVRFANDTYTSKEVDAWEKEVKTFDILVPMTESQLADPEFKPKHQKVQMTVPQIMSLYCLQKREQAKGHLLGGGIRVDNFKTAKGEIIAQATGVVITEKDINKIIESLSSRQLAVADKLQEFMNTVCSDWGNEVSMARFGIRQFGEENYFPIKADDSNLSQDEPREQADSFFKLLNASFAKSLKENANNRIVIGNIFDIFAKHTSDMAKYNALALPVLDAFKWYNYTEEESVGDEGAFETYGVKQSMEQAFGKDGLEYFTTFLKDINGAKSVSRDTLGNDFFKNAKIAAVGANIRVVALQPTSYVRASAVIDNKYLTKALGHKPKISMAEKYCGIAKWKAMGYYDINIQRGVTEQIKHKNTWKDKATDWSMKGAEMADKLTWGYLWNACELEIRDTRKDLTAGSKEFYEAISKRLREVIYATQVVDSTMTRSQMMRSGDRRDKMLTSFMSEPTLAYNMLLDAYAECSLDARKMGKAEALKKNGKRIARIVTAYTMTNAVAALVEAAFDAYRDDDDEEKDLAYFMKLYLSNFAQDMSVIGKIPYIKDIISMFQGYGASRTDVAWMQSIYYAMSGTWKLFTSDDGNPAKVIKNWVKTTSYMSGLPFYNVYRDSKLEKLISELFED